MPNHVQNRLTFQGDSKEVSALLSKIQTVTEDNTTLAIDFDKIIECPKEMHIESNGDLFPLDNQYAAHIELKAHLDSIRKFEEDPKRIENFIQGIRNYLKHGHASWYSWCVANWGTKWNAYGQPDERNTDDTIFFETAWSAPTPVIIELSKKFPGIRIIHTWADEDSGCNTGQIHFQNGVEVINHEPKNQSNEAYELYFELHPDRKDDFEMVEGKWEYKEDEE